MDTDSVRLNVTIPKDLFVALSQHAGPRKKSQFIAHAIRKQIEQEQRQALDKALEEGYRNGKAESLSIANEFADADLEGWDDY
jgi:metal-responsive CopG/Arc/MetJ family transcriptional regulator